MRNHLTVVSKHERKMKFVFISILFVIAVVQDASFGLPGGFSEERPATREIEELGNKV